MKNIFKWTIRNFLRNPVTNLINLLGLAVSLAMVIILSVYCYSELTVDHFQVNGDRIYLYGDKSDHIYTPGILKEQIDMNIPGVESSVRVGGSWEAPVFQVENKEPFTSDLIFADEDFFRLFTYKAIEGNPETALKEPMTVVISGSLAAKLFGKGQAVGKTLKMNFSNDLTVSAVIEEQETSSCLSFSALTSMATRKIVQPGGEEFADWGESNFQSFLLLRKGTIPNETAKSIFKLFPEEYQKYYKEAGLTPLKKIYFSEFTLFGSNYLRFGDKTKVMILLLVASLVLLIALVNFINISLSQWLEKIRQIGVMKVIGANRLTIFLHILFESFLLFFAAFIIGIFLVLVFYPAIWNYTGLHFNTVIILTPGFIFISVTGTFLLSVLFSILPALRISSSGAIDNMKKTVVAHSGNSFFKSFLVTIQFAIAIVLIAYTILIQKQVNFGISNIGFNQDNIIGIKLTPQLSENKDVFNKILLEEPYVKRISFTQYYPGKIISQWGAQLVMDGEKKQVDFDTFSADADFFELMGLQLSLGRFYSNDLSSDKGKIIVNEAFLREHKISNPLGGKISMSADRYYEIIGVVKDFHFKSVTQPITPLVIRNDSYSSYCLVNLQTGDFKSLNSEINNLKAAAAELSPSFPVELVFFEQAVENMYQSELMFRRIFSLFSGCAIVICCMGILAMSLSACKRRVKEIGIRKVNGAKVTEVMTMLNKDFVKWVAIAFIIATPISWFAMHKWLEDFAYKTNLSWWIFALAGVLALGIALLTISWQSWRAATRNPVEALRYE
jgi:putative ABC transport system permease protein